MITNVQSHAVPTGICNKLGNKGGIGISLNVGKTSFCFLTAHLAAFQDQIDRRTFEFELISKQIADNLGTISCSHDSGSSDDSMQPEESGGGEECNETLSQTVTTLSEVDESDNNRTHEEFKDNTTRSDDDQTNNIDKHCKCCNSCCSMYCCCCRKEHGNDMNPLLNEFDYVFWGGDFNYRINATRDVVDSLLEDNRHDVLIANDQLNLLLQFEKTFAGFIEGPLTFRPTYKYDIGTGKFMM